MPDSSTRSRRGKPQKPHPDFALFPHASGRWAKKVRGRFRYFGKVANDPKGEAALILWLDQKDDLLAGREPREQSDEPTVRDIANHFLAFKEDRLNSGELAERTWAGYKGTCEFVLDAFGKGRRADDLRPEDFNALRAKMAKRWGPVRLGNQVQTVRSLFRYAYEIGLLEKPVRFGPGFVKPSAKTLRKQRAASGPRMFKPAQIRAALDHATPNMRAMILLGVQAGFGNTDLAELPLKLINLKDNWLSYPRTKTGIPRRVPLWPETIAALRVVVENHPGNSPLLFIGKRGTDYIGNHRGYRVNQEAARVFKRAGIEGRTFYDLRRTFQTVAEGAHDLVAVQSIMGHAPSTNDMSATYRQKIDDERLLAVVNHVHSWLWPRPTVGTVAEGGQR